MLQVLGHLDLELDHARRHRITRASGADCIDERLVAAGDDKRLPCVRRVLQLAVACAPLLVAPICDDLHILIDGFWVVVGKLIEQNRQVAHDPEHNSLGDFRVYIRHFESDGLPPHRGGRLQRCRLPLPRLPRDDRDDGPSLIVRVEAHQWGSEARQQVNPCGSTPRANSRSEASFHASSEPLGVGTSSFDRLLSSGVPSTSTISWAR